MRHCRHPEESRRCSETLPLLVEMASDVGDNQVRNLGTIGGVIAHGDPAGDYDALALMLDAEIVTNKRTHQRARLLPRHLHDGARARRDRHRDPRSRWSTGRFAYTKFRRRLYDWAIVGVGAQKIDGGWRVGITNVGPTPVRAIAVEQALAGGAAPAEAAQQAVQGIDPPGDLRGSAEYKRHLATVLTQRALERAAAA